VQLFQRTTRRVTLTESGALLYPQAVRILEEMEQAAALVGQLQLEPKGKLKVVAGRHFAARYLLPHLPEWSGLYPEVRLELELAERIPDLDQEQVDVLIGMSRSAQADCIQKRILTTRYVLCASPEYWHSMPPLNHPEQLHTHRYIGHSMRTPVDEVLFSNGVSVQVIPHLLVNDAQAMLELAKQGEGVVMLHHYVVAQALKEGALQQRLKNDCLKEVPIWVAYPKQRYAPKKVHTFIDFVLGKIV